MLRRFVVVAVVLVAMMGASAILGVRSTPEQQPAGEATSTTGAGSAPVAGEEPNVSVTTTVPPAPVTTAAAAPVPIGVPVAPDPEPSPPAAGVDDDFAGFGVVTVAAGGAAIASTPNDEPFVRAREGLVFPADGMDGDWIRILTTCDETAWVHRSEVAVTTQSQREPIGDGFGLEQAVVVIDPGHGGPNIGTASPDGALLEKDVNHEIARRVRDLLNAPHSVDWDTGTVYIGTEIPAAGRVIMTRVGDDESGDYEAGLVFRASLANAAGADVMVSIHNNAGWEITLDHPGSDVYYQSQLTDSRRLGELLVEEFQRSLGGFDADWVGAIEWGAKSRISARDGQSQYYGLLRRAEMATVIAEGAYLANASEALLLATPDFRQAYAEAVYRAIVRFLATDETATAPSYDPIVWAGSAGSGDPVATCTIPSQSGASGGG